MANEVIAGAVVVLTAGVGCAEPQPGPSSPSIVAQHQAASDGTKSPTLGRSDAAQREANEEADDSANGGELPEQRVTSFEHNGYRTTHIPRVSPHSVGLVVIGFAKELGSARRQARKASKALGLPYAHYEYLPGFGFTDTRGGCTEQGYPCAPPSRFHDMEPSAFISIEHAAELERLRSKSFVLIAAHGPPGSALLSETLTKAGAEFPNAFVVATRLLWTEAITTKIADDRPPATEQDKQLAQ